MSLLRSGAYSMTLTVVPDDFEQDDFEPGEPIRAEKHEDLAPILIFPETYRFFLAHGRIGHEALGLYIHLIWTSERQHNNRVWADDAYLRNGLCIGQVKLKKLKGFLREHNLIAYHQERDEVTGRYVSRGQGGKRYIKVLYKSGGTESVPVVTGGTETVPDGPVVQKTGGMVNRPTGDSNQVPIRKRNSYQEGKASPPSLTTEANSIIDYLNQETGKHFKHSKSSRYHIIARLREDFTVADLQMVVDAQVGNWGSDEKMCKYLRPETIFGAKCEGYLQAARDTQHNLASDRFDAMQQQARREAVS